EVDVTLSNPLTLKDCGVEKPITVVEGYIFVDSNKNGLFDNNEAPFKDVIVFPSKIEPSAEVPDETMAVRPNEKGFFRIIILKPGTYRIGFRSSISTPVYSAYGKGTQQEFIATDGQKITNYNIAVRFEM
ncbi:MAG: hypothetical protein AAB581_01425, partial [Patescibacteria group bacterium]